MAERTAGATTMSSTFVTQVPGQQSSSRQAEADDIPAASQSTLLLQKKKEMAEVQQQLDRKKEEFRMRMQRCQEKEVELASKQEALKEQVRKFEKFLKENDAKRVRANRKATEEIKLRGQKEEERLRLAEEVGRIEKKRNELQEELAGKAIFEQFLESVCECTEYFEDIENILNRYDTLDAANKDLRTRMEISQNQQEAKASELTAYMKTTQTQTLVGNSEIAETQKELKELRLDQQDQQDDLERKEEDAKDDKKILGEINMVSHCPRRARCRAPPASL